MAPEQVNSWTSTSSSEESNIVYAHGRNITDEIAYIWMPGFGSGDEKDGKKFAKKMEFIIYSLDGLRNKSWVVDLRENTGGNCWPMLAGIGMILGEDTIGYFLQDDDYDPWIFDAGKSMNGMEVQCDISSINFKPYDTLPKVALLTSERTGSSGEVVTVAFKNRPNCILVGTKTGGYSTGNQNYSLSDGSMLFLATSVYCDRAKIAYPDGILPDIMVKNSNKDIDEELDAVVKWLEQK